MNMLFVSLSDLHFGEEDSVLTNLAVGKPDSQVTEPSQCMEALINYLHAIKHRLNEGKPIPYLILNGDIIELATSSYPVAVANFRIFLATLAQRRVFDRLVYLPGNHDHGLWSQIRDTYFIESLSRQLEAPKGLEHTTPLSSPRESHILTLLTSNLPMQAISPPFFVANPIFRLRSREGHEFLFHHGHLLESTYKMLTVLHDRLLSNLSIAELTKKPLRDHIAQIEKENWPWLDFVWSGFARAGRVGNTTEAIYELLKKPQGVEKLVKRVGDLLRNELNIPFVPDGLEDDLFRFLLRKALEARGIGSAERADQTKKPFNPDVQAMVKQFLSHYIKNQMTKEGFQPAEDNTSFIFGHIHKPFFEEFVDGDSGFGTTRVINSGGWTIESDEFKPIYAPGIVMGTNSGETALVTYKLDVDSGSEIKKEGGWDRTIELLNEHDKLAETISKTVKERRKAFIARQKETEKLLKSLSK